MKNVENSEYLYKIRHSAEHIFNQAIEELWPGKIVRAIGPAIDEGFYNDSRWLIEVSEEKFPDIEKKMQEIVDANLPFVKNVVSEKEAREIFKDNPFKQELITEFVSSGEDLTVYHTGDPDKKESVFVDLCAGPHVESTGEVKAYKLLSVAGAYWRGNEKNEMLTRIYGTAFPSKEELASYLFMIEEAKKRDHRKLGKELDLFTFSELIGSGLPLYTPKGAHLRLTINNYVESLQKEQGYTQVWTPQIAKAKLFITSGHYDKYKENMFQVVSNYSDEEFYLKPMNCPQHTQIYQSQARSYRDLPLRYTDFAMLYRDEKPGELNGLSRVRSFSQDDCHIFCREDQVDSEIDTALSMTKEIMATFGLTYRYRLSTRDPKHPEKYLGDPETWDRVEKWAVDIMKRNNIDYFDGPGEAAFYAPKMDLMATDALGREYQLSTIQIDYVMPERFGLEYTDTDGSKARPVMLHRAIVGSPERFLMILIEHFAGAFPAWISPVQVEIIPISEKFNDYGRKVADNLKKEGIRVEIDENDETMSNKIRKAQEQKVPYMLIVGGKEEENQTVSVRYRNGKQQNLIDLAVFTEEIKRNIMSKSIEV